jgi:hypothetical protein
MQRGIARSYLLVAAGLLRRGRADSAEGVGVRICKVAHSTKDGNPLGWHAHGTRSLGQADHEEPAYMFG